MTKERKVRTENEITFNIITVSKKENLKRA
jgi:hypothetical protein